MQKLSLGLEELIKAANPNGIKVGELLGTMSGRGFGFLLVVVSLLTAFLFPVGGFTAPFTLLIILLALQIMMGRSTPFITQRVRNKNISPRMVAVIQKRGIPFLRRIEKFSKPRLENLGERRLFRFFVGMAILVVGLVMLMPIPGTNAILAFPILLMGFGLANNDGLFILGGVLLGLTTVAVVTALVIAGGLALYHL